MNTTSTKDRPTAADTTTEPAAEQEEIEIPPTGPINISLQQLANVIYLCFLLEQRDEQKQNITCNTVDKVFIFLSILLGYLIAIYL